MPVAVKNIQVTMIGIRTSTLQDGERIMEIWRRSVDATHDFLSPQDRKDIENELAAFLPQTPLFLAVDTDDRAVGFMLLDDGHMEALFVEPGNRGSGVGRTLVEHALKLYPELTTDVNEENEQAIGFYERMNFRRTGRSESDSQGRPYPLIHFCHNSGT